MAIPLLLLATIFTVTQLGQTSTTDPPSAPLLDAGSSDSPGQLSPATAQRTAAPVPGTAGAPQPSAATSATDSAASGKAVDQANVPFGTLPAGPAFTTTGDGTYRVVAGSTPQVGVSAEVRTYTVEIENGINLPGGDAEFAALVDQTLADPRSWTAVKDISVRRIDATGGEPDFRVTLTSQMTVRGICGFSVELEASCYSREAGRAVINDARWVRGAMTYGNDLSAYRQYAINHEVGHALGSGHEPCGINGGLAPVMMQQSWSTADDDLAPLGGPVSADGKVCVPNPWPNPSAVVVLGAASGPVPTSPTG